MLHWRIQVIFSWTWTNYLTPSVPYCQSHFHLLECFSLHAKRFSITFKSLGLDFTKTCTHSMYTSLFKLQFNITTHIYADMAIRDIIMKFLTRQIFSSGGCTWRITVSLTNYCSEKTSVVKV